MWARGQVFHVEHPWQGRARWRRPDLAARSGPWEAGPMKPAHFQASPPSYQGSLLPMAALPGGRVGGRMPPFPGPHPCTPSLHPIHALSRGRGGG